MSNFLNNIQMASLVEAIQQAEDHSTGEIRVHIDQNSDDNNAKIAFDWEWTKPKKEMPYFFM